MTGAGEFTDEIVQAAIGGSQAAKRAAVHHLLPQIRLMVAARLSSARDRANAVDEVAQRVLVALLEGMSRIENRSVGGIKAFLSAIAQRKVADYICMRRESKGRSDTVSIDFLRQSGIDDDTMEFVLSASDTTPGRAAERSEQIQRMMAALDTLRPNYRDIIILSFFDRLSVGQIAEVLEISRPAASMQLMRALRQLRALLGSGDSTDDYAPPEP